MRTEPSGIRFCLLACVCVCVCVCVRERAVIGLAFCLLLTHEHSRCQLGDRTRAFAFCLLLTHERSRCQLGALACPLLQAARAVTLCTAAGTPGKLGAVAEAGIDQAVPMAGKQPHSLAPAKAEVQLQPQQRSDSARADACEQGLGGAAEHEQDGQVDKQRRREGLDLQESDSENAQLLNSREP